MLILITISLKFVPKGQINNIPALVQIMAWRRPGDKPLSEPRTESLLTHICVTRPQWVNAIRRMTMQCKDSNQQVWYWTHLARIQCGAIITRSVFSKIFMKDIGCLVWVQSLIDILPHFLQWYVQYHVILDHVIMALDCIWTSQRVYINWANLYWMFWNFLKEAVQIVNRKSDCIIQGNGFP